MMINSDHPQKAILDLRDLEAALFDMDGTMVDNSLFHEQAWKEFAALHGFPLTDDEFRHKISGKQNKHILPNVFGTALSDEQISRLADEKEALYREIYAPHLVPVTGLFGLIRQLKKKRVKIAVATMSPEKNRRFVLDGIGLGNAFDAIIDEEQIVQGKPHPEIYLKSAQVLGVSPHRCIVFEDTPSGIKAALAAGMKTVGLLTYHSAEELSEAHYVIKDFSQLILQG